MEAESTQNLVSYLVLEAGSRMEDLSPELVLTLPPSGAEREARLNFMLARTHDIAALLGAALAIAQSEQH